MEECDYDARDAKTGESRHISQQLICTHPIVKKVFEVGGMRHKDHPIAERILCLLLEGGYWVSFPAPNHLENANEWLTQIEIPIP